MSVELTTDGLRKRVSEAVERLISHRESDGGKVLLNVPVTYPSGSSVVVEIEQNADRIRVSDMGMGLVEAEMMAARDSYQRLTRRKAEEFGVTYDNRAMFALRTPSSRLEAAVVCVANASAQAASDAVRHASVAQARRQSEVVFEKVSRAFGLRSVSRSMEIRGKRSAWEARNVVVFPDAHRAIFEPMTGHAASVSSKFLMFSDLLDASLPVSLNAVVENPEDLDSRARMVGDVANIIKLGAADDVYRRYGRAA